MAHDALGPALRRIGRAAGPVDTRTDADLVSAFVATRCDAAFAELVARHGPVVLGACRRILGDSPDADDAFQASFLVLARRAGSIRPPGAVGAWLYGVAWKVATKARGVAARRAARDRLGAKPEAVADPMTDPTLRPLLDAELARLPDALRTAVVLCDLGGKTRAEAARELGWPEGTVATRLAKGRAALAERLTRRGVTLSVTGLTAAMAPNRTSAAVPSTLFESTLTATAAAAGITPAAVALANGATRAMTIAKLLPVAAVVFTGVLVAAGVAAMSSPLSKDESPKPVAATTRPTHSAVNARPEPDEPPKAEEVNGWKEDGEISLTGWLPGSVAYTPDGKSLVVGGSGGHLRVIDTATRLQRWEKTVGGTLAGVAVSPDGKTIGATIPGGVQLFDAVTGVPGMVLEEKDAVPTAVSIYPDKKFFSGNVALTSHKVVFGSGTGYVAKEWIEGAAPGSVVLSTTAKGKAPNDPYAAPLAVAPDGSAAVCTGPIDPATGRNVLWAYGFGGSGGNHVLEGHKATVVCAAWSADGKTIVTGDADGVVIVWDATTWKETSRKGFDRRVCAVAMTKDGDRIAVAVIANNQVEGAGAEAYQERVYVLESAKIAFGNPNPAVIWPPVLPGNHLKVKNDKPLGGSFKGIAGLAFSHDGKELAAAFCNLEHLKNLGELRGTVRVWKSEEKAPPVKPDPNDGRLALWLGNTIVDMKPDGSDLRSTEVRNAALTSVRRGDGSILAPDGKTSALVQISQRLGGDDLKARLRIAPVDPTGSTFELPEYTPRALIGYDGTKVYFLGTKGDVWDKETRKGRGTFSVDRTTGTVAKVPVPDDCTAYEFSANGRWLIYAGPKTENGSTTLRMYVASSDGTNPIEIVAPNRDVYGSVSPDGKRVVGTVWTYAKFRPEDESREVVKTESVLIDVATREQTVLRDFPKQEYIRSLKWNADGTKIAYVWSRFIGEAPDDRIVAPGDMSRDVKVFIADPDGSNATVVYETTTADEFRDFRWNK